MLRGEFGEKSPEPAGGKLYAMNLHPRIIREKFG